MGKPVIGDAGNAWMIPEVRLSCRFVLGLKAARG
jgi:hypothetical protein